MSKSSHTVHPAEQVRKRRGLFQPDEAEGPQGLIMEQDFQECSGLEEAQGMKARGPQEEFQTVERYREIL